MNVVPSPRVRRLADAMIRDAEEMNGADVVIRHAKSIRGEDLPALLALLLTSTKVHKKIGAPRLPELLTDADRLRGYAAYKRGDRTEFAIQAFREYQRIQQRRHRRRKLTVA